MNKLKVFQLTILIPVLSLVTLGQNNIWNGIVPLKSTRADVEKILGKPITDIKDKSADEYKTKNERVFVQYSMGTCDTQPNNGWNIPKGKVLLISIYPNLKPKFAEFKFDKTKFEVLPDYDMKNIIYYSNDKDGVNIEVDTVEGVINAFRYGVESKDDYLRCKKK
jgi:hypothetical protein